MDFADVGVIVIGVAAVIIGLVSERRFYSGVLMPLRKEEREDTRPPTTLQRIGYIGFGLFLTIFGIWRLL